MLNQFFKWLRNGARDAILDGVADAAETLTGGDHPLPPRLAALAAKLTPVPALPVAEPDAGQIEGDKPARKPKGAK